MTSIRVSVGNPISVRLSRPVWRHVSDAFAVAAFPVALPSEGYRVNGGGPIGTIGLPAVWRCGWGILHFEGDLVTRDRVTTVASVIETDGQRIFKVIFRSLGWDYDKVDLVIGRVDGAGERDGLTCASKTIARRCAAKDGIAAAKDGDRSASRDIIRECLELHLHDRRSGETTADEMSGFRGSGIFFERCVLGFVQHHALMSSRSQMLRGIVIDRPCDGFILPPCSLRVAIAREGAQSLVLRGKTSTRDIAPGIHRGEVLRFRHQAGAGAGHADGPLIPGRSLGDTAIGQPVSGDLDMFSGLPTGAAMGRFNASLKRVG